MTGKTDKPIKVCLIQDYLPPYRIPLFTRIAEAPHIDFTLLLTARRHASYAQWTENTRNPPFRCIPVPGWRLHIKSENESGLNPALFFKLVGLRPDVVICGGFSINSIMALAYKVLFRKRAVVWTEATETTESFLSYPDLRTKVRRVLARLVDGFIDAGTQARDYAKSLLPKGRDLPFFRSYNAVDNDEFARRCEAFRQDEAAFAAFKGRFARRNILFSGQLIERKNIRTLIDVYENILSKSVEPVGLIVLGQGPLDGYLAERKKTRGLDHLYLEGFRGPDEYFKYFAVADAFMLLSIYDCNPLVIFEAMAAGLPTVCSANAGNAIDFIEEGRNGFIVAPEDKAAAARGGIAILEAGDTSAMAAVSREMVRKANYEDAAAGFIGAIDAVMRRQKA
jgi:glycosyltransferase involved in cell wall biosynthesis